MPTTTVVVVVVGEEKSCGGVFALWRGVGLKGEGSGRGKRKKKRKKKKSGSGLLRAWFAINVTVIYSPPVLPRVLFDVDVAGVDEEDV